MNRKLRNTILAFSVTGMVLALGLMAAGPVVDAGPGEVRVMTVHQAKGLEFDVVVLPGARLSAAEVRRMHWAVAAVGALAGFPLAAPDQPQPFAFVQQCRVFGRCVHARMVTPRCGPRSDGATAGPVTTASEPPRG